MKPPTCSTCGCTLVWVDGRLVCPNAVCPAWTAAAEPDGQLALGVVVPGEPEGTS